MLGFVYFKMCVTILWIELDHWYIFMFLGKLFLNVLLPQLDVALEELETQRNGLVFNFTNSLTCIGILLILLDTSGH